MFNYIKKQTDIKSKLVAADFTLFYDYLYKCESMFNSIFKIKPESEPKQDETAKDSEK